MMEGLLARGAVIAARRAEMLVATLAQAARDELPADISVEPMERGIALIGRRLARRMVDDARLRGLGLLAKGWMR